MQQHGRHLICHETEAGHSGYPSWYDALTDSWFSLWIQDGNHHLSGPFSGSFHETLPAESAETTISWPHRSWRRWLAGGGEEEARIDYSVLSVGVMTLGLLMVVEVLRHRLDQMAASRVLFKAVLEGVYTELATLGMVEFFLYLLGQYYDNLQYTKKEVFTDVHFVLFYTAILNAFQTVVVAMVTRRVSRRLWIQTEMLELNHYVEIREEFARLSQQIEQINKRWSSIHSSAVSSSAALPLHRTHDHSESSSKHRDKQEETFEWTFSWNREALVSLLKGWLDMIQYPRLQRRYRRLLVQVRFHELRVHFLQAYQLPLKLRLSDYLMLSEQQVLLSMVHVSSLSWLLLTGGVNLLYFVLGIVSYETEQTSLVGTTLSGVYFGMMGTFVVLARLVYGKMKAIFNTIVHEKKLWDVQHIDPNERERLSRQQLALFWGSEPAWVVAIIQFMQFGYALSLSVVIIYWDYIREGHNIPMSRYVVVLFVCYGVFVYLTGQVIPRYTMCTSLGQLVDHRRLQETLANFRLQEARRQRLYQNRVQQQQHQRPTDGGGPRIGAFTPPGQSTLNVIESYTSQDDQDDQNRRSLRQPKENWLDRNRTSQPEVITSSGSSSSDTAYKLAKSAKQGVQSVFNSILAVPNQPVNEDNPSPPSSNRRRIESVDKAALMAQLVRLDTTMLRATLPELEREQLAQRDAQRDLRGSQRRKTLSDGVAAMASMGRSSSSKDDTWLVASHSRRSLMDGDDESIATANAEETAKSPSAVTVQAEDKTGRADRLSARRASRQARKKAVSDGVAAMAWIQGPRLEDMTWLGGENIQEGNELQFETSGSQESVRKSTSHDSHSKKAKSMGQLPLEDLDDDDIIAKEPAITQSFEDVTSKEVAIKEDHDDKVSVCSNESDGGVSDVDDIPEVQVLSQTYRVEKKETIPRIRLRDRMRAYFLSKLYVVISNVFGTMVAFFFVGERVERFLHTQGIASEGFVSFDFSNEISFWMLTSYFILFLIGDFLVYYTFHPVHLLEQVSQRKVVIAAGIDIVLSATCLVVFMVAEADRCCIPDIVDGRRLAESEVLPSDFAESMGPAPCECPMFGSRLYGGLGKLEPYISLVALRLFRHWFAKRIVLYMDRTQLWVLKEKPVEKHGAGIDTDPFAVFSHEENSIRRESEGLDDKGTAVELWEATVRRHPEIVAKYGEFSGEMLQAMLGILVDEAPKLVDDTGVTIEVPVSRPTLKRQSFVLSKQFSGLTPQAQGIIMAGQHGHHLPESIDVGKVEQQLLAEHNGTAPAFDPNASLNTRDPVQRDPMLSDPIRGDLVQGDVLFESPDTPLVRSMRRVDRKLLPILDKWSVVDVVMTRFELLYFDAVGVDIHDADSPSHATYEAMVATKGGKGLRLCDVAHGRKVVGRQPLSEIDSIFVERILPSESEGVMQNGDERPNLEVENTEYWKQLKVSSSRRVQEWATVKQDRLKIHTLDGNTLYLRFYSDYEDDEVYTERVLSETDDDANLYKSSAFQWAQTMGRFCGPGQLKQALPHFGEGTGAELRDYLMTSHRHDGDRRGHRRASALSDAIFRLPSVFNLAQANATSAEGSDQRSHPLRDYSFRGASSDLSGDGRTDSLPRPNTYKRSVTVSHLIPATTSTPIQRLDHSGDSLGVGLPRPNRYRRSSTLGDAVPNATRPTLRRNLSSDMSAIFEASDPPKLAEP